MARTQSVIETGGTSGLTVEKQRPPRQGNAGRAVNDNEGGFRWRDESTRIDVALFDSELTDKITRRTMIVPDDVVGQTIGGQEIIAQDEEGRIYVALDPDPVVSRANLERARVWGVEWRLERFWSILPTPPAWLPRPFFARLPMFRL